ncbi:unnamed protein product [Mytilus coruscus]|uniref:BEN domain-containing protein n=1 Tax=Mytilus coruscus TaxID=42192 RepID=A0A6J8EDU1_MYTCO|nr:unnamed protein product [Mytilus coruscus]
MAQPSNTKVKSQGQTKVKTKVLASTKIPVSHSVKQPDSNQTQKKPLKWLSKKKIENLRDFSTQTDLSIPIDCDVLIVEDQIPEPVRSSPTPNHEASLQKKTLLPVPNTSTNDSTQPLVNISSPDQLDLPSDIGLNISAFESFVANIDIRKGILQNRDILERIEKLLLKKNCIPDPQTSAPIKNPPTEKMPQQCSTLECFPILIDTIQQESNSPRITSLPSSPIYLATPLPDLPKSKSKVLVNQHLLVTLLKPAALTCQLHNLQVTPEVNNSTAISEAVLQDAKKKAGECRRRFATTIFRSVFNVNDTFDKNVNGKVFRSKTQKEQINHTKMAILKLITFQHYPCPSSETENIWNTVTRALDKAN